MAQSKSMYMTLERRALNVFRNEIQNYIDSVDCIVNPTLFREGRGLCGTGQIAKYLLENGGDEYQKACSMVKLSPGTKCVMTNRGYKCKILHSTRESREASDKDTINKCVYKAVLECLQTAERENVTSIVLPFMYTGEVILRSMDALQNV